MNLARDISTLNVRMASHKRAGLVQPHYGFRALEAQLSSPEPRRPYCCDVPALEPPAPLFSGTYENVLDLPENHRSFAALSRAARADGFASSSPTESVRWQSMRNAKAMRQRSTVP